jgi:limonene-1,2-epoxide hydrolase
VVAAGVRRVAGRVPAAPGPGACYAYPMDAMAVVDRFMACFDAKDLDGALELVADDVYYDNVPVGDMRGRDAMREFLLPLVGGDGPVSFEVHRQAASGNLVFNERTDRMVVKGKQIALPVAGVFEVVDGKITFWRDYFDNGMFMQQLKG